MIRPTAHKHTVNFDEGMTFECGKTLTEMTLAYETLGTLNEKKDNVILVLHALSGDAHVGGQYPGEEDTPEGWWEDAVGPGKALDTDKYFFVCSNIIGGCKGSSGPSSINPETGKPYGMDFPFVTVKDMVQAQSKLMDYLGIEKLLAVCGGSLGGMQALQWSLDFPERIGSAIILASTPRSSAENIALNEAARQAIYADPNWNEGNYYDGPHPDAGLAVARMVGHITYMSNASMEQKFGRRLQTQEKLEYHFGQEFQVESYLNYRGKSFTKRFDANSFIYISRAIDYFDLTANQAVLTEVMHKAQCHFLVASYTSDWLFLPRESAMLVEALRQAGKEVEYKNFESSYGHDAFLLEVGELKRIIHPFLEKVREENFS